MTDDYISPELVELVKQTTYKPGWCVYLEHSKEDNGAGGWQLLIVSCTENSLKPGETIRVGHPFLVPPASYKRDVWAAWIRDRYADVENHELGEFLRFNGVREFAPHHSTGEDPYRVWHIGDYATAAKKQGDA